MLPWYPGWRRPQHSNHWRPAEETKQSRQVLRLPETLTLQVAGAMRAQHGRLEADEARDEIDATGHDQGIIVFIHFEIVLLCFFKCDQCIVMK